MVKLLVLIFEKRGNGLGNGLLVEKIIHRMVKNSPYTFLVYPDNDFSDGKLFWSLNSQAGHGGSIPLTRSVDALSAFIVFQ